MSAAGRQEEWPGRKRLSWQRLGLLAISSGIELFSTCLRAFNS
jgi:hypothetical protein